MIQKVVETLDCVGCGACSEICTHQAINLFANNEGFKFPKVDGDICIQCGMCMKVCPVINAEEAKNPRGIVYAAANKNLNVLLESSSGGVFSAIANYILERNGVIFGAAFNEELILTHRKIDNVEELSLLRGSKYLQSDMQATFKMIKGLINDNILVYFVGTACQVTALKSFIRKDSRYLFTSDIVCHGVPSQKIFNVFVSAFEKKENVKIVNYKFRDKEINGWSCSSSSSLVIDNSTGKQKKIRYNKILNAYFEAFISGSINRECCYKCKFTTEERVSDITLADFWGVENYHEMFYTDHGVSLIIVNSSEGREVLSALQEKLLLVESKYEYGEEINKCLYESTPRPQNRDYIYESIDGNPDLIIERFIKKGWDGKYVKYLLKSLLRKNSSLYASLFRIKKIIIG